MRNLTLTALLSLLAAVAFLGCIFDRSGLGADAPDAGIGPDTGIVVDAATTPDAGIVVDAGTTLDAETTPDAQITPDADTTPTCTDGVLNGDELDVDCGGSCPDACTRIFVPDARAVLILELNGDTTDQTGAGRDAGLIGGTFVLTAWGQGLSLPGTDPQGLDWSAYATLLTHPYTIEMVLIPQNTGCYRKLFSFADDDDDGWYYCNGFTAYPNPAVGTPFPANVRHYLAVVSTGPDTIDLYSNGVYLGSSGASFTAPPDEAIFFRDDSDTNRGEILSAVVDGLRLSNVSRSPAEIAAVQQRLDLQP